MRFQRANIVRGLVAAAVLVLSVIPLVAGSIGRAMTGSAGWRAIEALSPLYPSMLTSRYPDEVLVDYARSATAGYGVLGVLLVFVTWAMARNRRSLPSSRLG